MKTLIVITIILSAFSVYAKPPKESRWRATQAKVLNPMETICSADLYKIPKGKTSPIFELVKRATNKSYVNPNGQKTSTLNNPHLNWKNSSVQADVFRGGKEIFNAMADLIRSAEKEVLIQTFIFDFASTLAQDYIFKAIIDLYNSHKVKMDKGLAKDPVVVRLIFDIIGGMKGLNINELFINTRFAGGAFQRWSKIRESDASFGGDPDYEIQFPINPVLDPKYMRFELKGHRHDVFPTIVTVSHSKTAIVDRKRALVTGANIIDYHLTNEYKTPKGQELMVDHGFFVFDSAALMATDDFYNLWYKKENTHRKWSGFSTQYNGNVKADERFNYNGQAFTSNKIKRKNTTFKNLLKLKGKQIFYNIPTGVVGRESAVGKGFPDSPQNDAFITILRNAKSHINVASPSLNSMNLMQEIVNAIKRDVDVNFLLSEHYQDYNFHLQEGGSNQMAVEWIKEEINKFKKANPNKEVGDFNLRWFVTRSGNISGKIEKEPFKFKTRINEKFWNHNHTKFLSADNQIAMVGSANFDQQSWYNSREFNMIFDSNELSSYWCRKVFAIDFMRAKRYGEKLSSGERCTVNSDCNQAFNLFCNNNVFQNPWFKNWRCVPRNGTGLSGSYCEENAQCRSRNCKAKKCVQ